MVLSLGPIPSGSLKKLRNIDNWSSLRSYLSVREISVTRELEAYLSTWIGSNSTLSPAIEESLNVKYIDLMACIVFHNYSPGIFGSPM